ncbi:MAG: GerMN domain-containing protein [Defluviitaleaceae bacterium]|nr:GerMN domain-containing protein [Defluviitaleaceae bacterium]
MILRLSMAIIIFLSSANRLDFEDFLPEGVTIQFFYLCTQKDPDFMMLPEAYLYLPEEISVQNFREDFIRLMYKHTGIDVLDLWREDSKLYVNLHPDEAIFFNHGSSGSLDRGNRLIKTLASFPSITSFEILVGGERGVSTSHFCFDFVAVVEDGEVVLFR